MALRARESPRSASNSRELRTSNAVRSLCHPYPSRQAAARPSSFFARETRSWIDANFANLTAAVARSLNSVTSESRWPPTLRTISRAASVVCRGKHRSLKASSQSSSNQNGDIEAILTSQASFKALASRPIAIVQRSTAASRSARRTPLKLLRSPKEGDVGGRNSKVS